MATLIITRGLPASGKTTWAKKIQAAGEEVLIVCRDDIRQMLHGNVFSRENELITNKVRDYSIREGLKAGRTVICADTNISLNVVEYLEKIASQHDALVYVEDKFLDVPFEVCIERDRNRPDSVGEDVIMRMARQLESR
jgi:predicted kinase